MARVHSFPKLRPLRWICGGLLLVTAAVWAQQGPTPEQLAEQKRVVELAWQRARQAPDLLQNWQALLIMESIRAEAQAAGQAPEIAQRSAAAARDAVLDEWRRLRPQSGGPDLVLTWGMQDAAEQAAAQLALLERYPDDPIILERAGQIFQSRGETARWGALVDGFARRQPDNPEAFRLLAAYGARIENWAIAESALERWGALRPGDPRFVEMWISSPLAQRDTARTDEILARFFRAASTDDSTANQEFQICSRVAGSEAWAIGGPSAKAAARSCLARLTNSPAPGVAEQAVSRLAEVAAAEGDLEEALRSIDALPVEARSRALVSIARALAAKQDCDAALAVIERALASMPRTSNVGGDWSGPAGVLRECSKRPEAEAVFLRLLENAPEAELQGIVSAWSTQVDRGYGMEWMGPLPADKAAAILEQRLAKLPASEAPHGLMFALFNAYQHGDLLAVSGGRALSFFERWERARPHDLRGEPALAYARALFAANRAADAEAMLHRRLANGADPKVVEVLAGLALARGDRAALDRLGKTLDGREDDYSRGLATLLRARVARLDGNLEASEGLYRQAVASAQPPPEAAQELMNVAAARKLPLAPLATELCARPAIYGRDGSAERCAARLLAGAGNASGAVEVLARAADELPDDVSALRRLAQEARGANRNEVARQALRKAIGLDPKSPDLWSELVQLEGERFPIADLERTISEARRQLPELTWQIQTARAKAYRQAGDPRRAIEALMESRLLADNDYTIGWTNQWLREAYAELGAWVNEPARSAQRPPAIRTPGVERLSPARLLDLAQEWAQGSAKPLVEGGPSLDGLEAWALLERVAISSDEGARELAKGQLITLFERGRRGVPQDRGRARALWLEVGPSLERRAAAGDPRSAVWVGLTRLGTSAGPSQPAAARALFEKAAAAPEWVGQSWAFHSLAWMRWNGVGFAGASEGLEASAVRDSRRAIALGNAGAKADLGLRLLRSKEVGVCAEGLRLLEEASRAGSTPASASLGNAYLWGSGSCVSADASRAQPHLEAAVQAREPGADYNLGFAALQRGDGARAVEILGRADSPSGVLTLELLAFAYTTGSGVPRDVAAARRWRAEAARHNSDLWSNMRGPLTANSPALFRDGVARTQRLAAAGDAAALATLAEWASVGSFLEAEPVSAARWALAAAEKGSPEGMRILANAYGSGNGVPTDKAAWLEWLRRGAEAGNSFCAMFLGNALLRGEAVTPDRAEGLRWLERAAESGNWWATADLAHVYDEGRDGVKRDRAQAIAWHRRAAEAGRPESRGWLAVNAPDR